MSEIKTEIKENDDGSFTITDAHSTADILRWLLTQDSKENILYLLDEIAPQRTWVGLTDEETERLIHNFGGDPHTLLDEVDARLRDRNT